MESVEQREGCCATPGKGAAWTRVLGAEVVSRDWVLGMF